MMAAEIGHIQAGTAAPAQIAAAVKRASAATGVGFDYLMKTAMRESSLNADARAKTSSAAGLFQFIEQTWLGAVKAYGGRHGLAAYAADIVRGENGAYSVPDVTRREEILNLRFDPAASAALAGELAGENKRTLEHRLGRAVRGADLYAAHFLGPAGAVKLLSAASNSKAADLLPSAARANPAVFYDQGRARTVGEVIASFARSLGEAGATTDIQANKPAAVAPAALSLRDDTKNLKEAAPAQAFDPAPREFGRSPAFNVAAAPAASRAAQLSLMAIKVLQALDPTRLGANEAENREKG